MHISLYKASVGGEVLTRCKFCVLIPCSRDEEKGDQLVHLFLFYLFFLG